MNSAKDEAVCSKHIFQGTVEPFDGETVYIKKLPKWCNPLRQLKFIFFLYFGSKNIDTYQW